MNQRIRQLAEQCRFEIQGINCEVLGQGFDEEKFAELIVQECVQLNKQQSHELAGVIEDVEHGSGFDSVCLNTVKRVEQYLTGNTLQQHFRVEL